MEQLGSAARLQFSYIFVNYILMPEPFALEYFVMLTVNQVINYTIFSEILLNDYARWDSVWFFNVQFRKGLHPLEAAKVQQAARQKQTISSFTLIKKQYYLPNSWHTTWEKKNLNRRELETAYDLMNCYKHYKNKNKRQVRLSKPWDKDTLNPLCFLQIIEQTNKSIFSLSPDLLLPHGLDLPHLEQEIKKRLLL